MFYLSENNVKVSCLLVNVIYPYLMRFKKSKLYYPASCKSETPNNLFYISTPSSKYLLAQCHVKRFGLNLIQTELGAEL